MPGGGEGGSPFAMMRSTPVPIWKIVIWTIMMGVDRALSFMIVRQQSPMLSSWYLHMPHKGLDAEEATSWAVTCKLRLRRGYTVNESLYLAVEADLAGC